MTNEEAIMVLGMVDAYGLADDAKQIAIKALEKQIPKKPEIVKTEPIDNDYRNGGQIEIEVCQCRFMIGQFRKYKWAIYCPRCGQAIDWSEDD